MPKLATHTDLPDQGSCDREFDNIYRSIPTSQNVLPLYGDGAPSTTPNYIGQTYLDTTAKREYRAYGTNSSADWLKVPQPSYIRRKNGLTRGSTNTNVVIYGTAVESSGTDITYVNSATNGDSFTVNTSGVYSISAYAVISIALYAIGIEVGTLTNTLIGTHTRCFSSAAADGANASVSWVGYVQSGESIWVAINNTTIGDVNSNQVTITGPL